MTITASLNKRNITFDYTSVLNGAVMSINADVSPLFRKNKGLKSVSHFSPKSKYFASSVSKYNPKHKDFNKQTANMLLDNNITCCSNASGHFRLLPITQNTTAKNNDTHEAPTERLPCQYR